MFLSVYKKQNQNVGTLHKFPFGRNKRNERKDMDRKVRGSQTELDKCGALIRQCDCTLDHDYQYLG